MAPGRAAVALGEAEGVEGGLRRHRCVPPPPDEPLHVIDRVLLRRRGRPATGGEPNHTRTIGSNGGRGMTDHNAHTGFVRSCRRAASPTSTPRAGRRGSRDGDNLRLNMCAWSRLLICHRGKAKDKGGNPGAGARGAGTRHGSGGLGAGGEGDPGRDHGVAVGVRDDVHRAVPDPEHPDPVANPPPRISLGERRGTDCPLPRPTAGGEVIQVGGNESGGLGGVRGTQVPSRAPVCPPRL